VGVDRRCVLHDNDVPSLFNSLQSKAKQSKAKQSKAKKYAETHLEIERKSI